MVVKEFEGKTKEEALKAALTELNLTEKEVKIEYIDDGKVGFFGFRGGRPARIKVYFEEKDSDDSVKAREFILKLFKSLNISCEIFLEKEDKESVYLKINSDSSALVIGRRGKNLEAIQFLTNVVVNKNRENWRKIVLDIEGYRDKREESIKKLALKTADMVRKTKKSKLLDPMNPFERRLVHMTLQDFKDIETKSEGDGIYKKIKVSLK